MSDPFDYFESRDDADELLAEFGQAVSVRRTTATAGAQPWEPARATADYATIAAVVDYNDRQIDGENIQRTDRRAIISAGPLTALGITSLAAPDALVIGDDAFPIIRSKPINPGGVVVL